jgi:hypothetical protein
MIFPNKSVPHLVKAVATAITGSYVAGTIFSTDEHNFLGILVEYTKGDESTLQIKVESSIDGGTTYGQQTAEVATGGAIATTLAERTLTGTGNYWIVINPIKADTIKISSKATGGTPTGTSKITAITGWV